VPDERRIERSQVVALPLDRTFAFFSDASNLEEITPPWLRFRILTPRPIAMRAGTTIDYRLALHRVPLRWRSEIVEWEPGRRFVDRQVRGPFGRWEHTHTFESRGGGTVIRDSVRYRMPLGIAGAAVHRLLVRGDLERIFDFRRDAVARLLGDPS